MTGRKIYLRMIRRQDDYLHLSYYEQMYRGYPPPPFTKTMTPREDWQQRPYWLRTRSNPYQTNYH